MDDIPEDLTDAQAVAAFREMAKAGDAGAVMVTACNGSEMLQGMVPIFELAVGQIEDEEERKAWWRGFAMAAHTIALDHVGWDEGVDALRGLANILLERRAGQKTTPTQ